MASITIRGTKYELLFDMWALEQIEQEFGGVRKMYANLRGAEGTENVAKTMAAVFRILGNSARDAAGMAPNLTVDEVRHVSVGKITEAIREAIDEGMKSETTDGNEADDEVHDEYLEELEKNV